MQGSQEGQVHLPERKRNESLLYEVKRSDNLSQKKRKVFKCHHNQG